jgi:8-oxo-dGTP pyrophosphatase MutT (NUDIX family)
LYKAPGNFTVAISVATSLDPVKVPEDVEQLVNENWNFCKTRNNRIFDGPVFSLQELRVSPDAVQMQLAKSSYKYVLFTHFTEHPKRLETKLRAVGASAITVSNDGFVVVGKRAEHLGVAAGLWHFVPAGNLDREDIEDLVKCELQEELGMDPEATVSGLRLWGILDTGEEQGNKIEFVFVLNLNVNFSDVLGCHDQNGDQEHTEIMGIKNLNEIPGSSTSLLKTVLKEFYEKS